MSRATYAPREEYVGTGLLTAYTFDFKITDNTHILVMQTDDDFVETFKVRGDDVTYLTSVTYDANEGGGTVNLLNALPSGHHLFLLLADDEPLQPKEFKNKSDFTLKRFEDALDYLSGQIQRLAYLSHRSVKYDDSVLDSEESEILIPRPQADSVLVYNDTTDALEWIDKVAFKGDTGTMQVGTTTTVAAGDPLTITNVGTPDNAILDFEIPGAKVFTVGTVTTVLPADPATVADVGDADTVVLDFEIPQGLAATVDVGTTSTLTAGSPATVVNSGTTGAAIFDFGIPEGERGLSFIQGNADPTGVDGEDNDTWLNNVSGELFLKGGGVWVSSGSIIGPVGPAGSVDTFNTRPGPDILPVAGDYDASMIDYDPSTSLLAATDAQAAIDELKSRMEDGTAECWVHSAIIGDPGLEAAGIQALGQTFTSSFKVSNIYDTGDYTTQFILHKHSTNSSPLVLYARSNTDDDSHADMDPNMTAGSNYYAGHLGTDYKIFCGTEGRSSNYGTDTLSETSSPGMYLLSVTMDGSVWPPMPAFEVNSDLRVYCHGYLKIADATGYIHLPLHTTAERTALTADEGFMVYDTDIGTVMVYDGIVWRRAGGVSNTITDDLTLTASDTVAIDATQGLQTFRVQGNAAAITMSTTPFGTTPPDDGAIIYLVGNDDTNTVTISPNDAADGCLMDGDVILTKGAVVGFMWVNALDRYVRL
jgi:hypothetical protein